MRDSYPTATDLKQINEFTFWGQKLSFHVDKRHMNKSVVLSFMLKKMEITAGLASQKYKKQNTTEQKL